MSRRLFPRTFLLPWGLVGRHHRCPRCHVHRFEWEISRQEWDRLSAGHSDKAFGNGQCTGCSWRAAVSMDREDLREWFAQG
jgi:hypothetical protein